MNCPNVSIIILTKNAGDNFHPLMEKIFSQDYRGQFEVILIDSGSQDDTLQKAKKYPVKLIQIKSAEFHHGKTRNLGGEIANGDILVYITQDALPENECWLTRLISPFSDSIVGMVIGKQLPWESTKPPEKFFYYYYFPDFRVSIDKNNMVGYHDNVFISNVNSAISKRLWKRFRFSEKINMTEDKEFATRILSAGWKIIYEPEASVYHAHDFGICSIFWRSWDYGLSLLQEKNSFKALHRFPIKKTFNYFISEFGYLIKMKYIKWIPYSLIYEISRYSGTLFGKIGFNKRH